MRIAVIVWGSLIWDRRERATDTPKLSAALGYNRSAPPDVQTPVVVAGKVRWPEG